jgi:hypothetical protein
MFYRKRKAKYEAQIKELEKEKSELVSDLHAVTVEPESERAIIVTVTYRLRAKFLSAPWHGESSRKNNTGQGMLSQSNRREDQQRSNQKQLTNE